MDQYKDFIPDEPDFIPDEPIDAPEVVTPRRVGLGIPDSFREGFMRSMLDGEALETGLEGAKGFAKGAILDIPETIKGIPSALETGFNLINPTRWAEHNPIDTLRSIGSGIKDMYDTTMMAGSRPEEFGRMMGQQTGQPLVTAGAAKSVGPVVRTTGRALEGAGNIMERYQPVSGFLPRLIEGRTLRNIERGVGQGIQSIGNRLKEVGRGSKSVQGEIVLPDEGMDVPFTEIDNTKRLGSSRTSFYNEAEYPEPPIELGPSGRRGELPPSKVIDYAGPSSLVNETQLSKELENLPRLEPKIEYGGGKEFLDSHDLDAMMRDSIRVLDEMREINRDSSFFNKNKKPRYRINRDGTFTDTDTGETFEQVTRKGNTITKVYSPKD